MIPTLTRDSRNKYCAFNSLRFQRVLMFARSEMRPGCNDERRDTSTSHLLVAPNVCGISLNSDSCFELQKVFPCVVKLGAHPLLLYMSLKRLFCVCYMMSGCDVGCQPVASLCPGSKQLHLCISESNFAVISINTFSKNLFILSLSNQSFPKSFTL